MINFGAQGAKTGRGGGVVGEPMAARWGGGGEGGWYTHVEYMGVRPCSFRPVVMGPRLRKGPGLISQCGVETAAWFFLRFL